MKNLDNVLLKAGEICTGRGDELVSLRWKKEDGVKILEVIIDRAGGVSIDEASEVNRLLSDWLDEIDFDENDYCLEVSSRGTERELLTDEDREQAIGKQVLITLLTQRKDIKTASITGTLLSVGKEGLVVRALIKGATKTLTVSAAEIKSIISMETTEE